MLIVYGFFLFVGMVVLVRPFLPSKEFFFGIEILAGQTVNLTSCVLVDSSVRVEFIESVVALFSLPVLSPFRFRFWVEIETEKEENGSDER